MDIFKIGDLVVYKDKPGQGEHVENKIRRQRGQNIIPYLDEVCQITKMGIDIFEIKNGDGTRMEFRKKEINIFRRATKAEIKENELKEMFVKRPRK